MPLPRKLSIAIVAIYVLAFGVAVAIQSPDGAVFFGTLAAKITDFRFIIVCLIAATVIRRLNVFVLSVAVGVLVAVFLHLTLQEHWRMLGVEPNLLKNIAMNFAAALFALALVHAVIGSGTNAQEAEN
jgi:hypothetical protein